MINAKKGNYKAILAYLTFIGFIISYILNIEEKDTFVSYHLRNMFGLIIILFIAFTFQGSEYLQFIGNIIWVLSFFLWSYSIVMAITGKQKGIPIVTDLFQKWFKFIA